MAAQEVIRKTDPHRPVDFNEKAIAAVIDKCYAIADVKKDGVRLNLCVEPVETKHNSTCLVDWLSREGKRFPVFEKHGEPLDEDPRWVKFFDPNQPNGAGMFVEGFMLDAEIIIDQLKAKDTAGTLRRFKDGPLDVSRLNIYVFAVVPLSVIDSGEEYKITNATMKYHVEFQVAKLREHFPEINWQVVESLDVFHMDPQPPKEVVCTETGRVLGTVAAPPSLVEVYESVRERGEEGLVIKDPLDCWRRGKVNGHWKMVPDDNEDGKVVGYVWGTPGKANEGKVIGFEVLLESGHVVNACKITKDQMDEFTANVQADPNYYMGWTVKVTFMERYEDGSLRHPSFDSFRGISSPEVKE